MTWQGWLQFGALAGLFVALTPPLGRYMARVYQDERTFGERAFAPVERAVYRLTGVDPDAEQRWTTYAFSLIAFSAMSWAVLYALLRLQGFLPLNPTGMPAVPPDLAFNTAMSFTSNTNWQNYSGEQVLSHLVQMAGLTVQNFASAAAGMAVLAALIRGFARRRSDTVGNFWVDLVRTVTRILLPISVVAAIVLVSQGVLQNLDGFLVVTTLVLESAGNPALTSLGVDQSARADSAGGNLEGKEVRFGPAASGLWAATTTGTSNGSVNSMHDSYTPWEAGWPRSTCCSAKCRPGAWEWDLPGCSWPRSSPSSSPASWSAAPLSTSVRRSAPAR